MKKGFIVTKLDVVSGEFKPIMIDLDADTPAFFEDETWAKSYIGNQTSGYYGIKEAYRII